IAQQGVDAKRNLIIINMSGRHKQDAALFEEMRQLAVATKPDLIVFVMDGSSSCVQGECPSWRCYHHGKGGGTLRAVAATKSPIIFLGTGERLNDLEVFESRSFANKLLGMADLKGLMDKIKNTVMSDESELMEKFTKGTISFKFLCDQLENISSMGY
ncbi:hypothetical protein SELMODRAFT_122109, partial [Selaginella moellendorffii]